MKKLILIFGVLFLLVGQAWGATKLDVTDIGYIPARILCVNNDIYYGRHDTYYLRKWDKEFNILPTTVIASGHAIRRIFTTSTDGLLFADMESAGLHTLYRTIDGGIIWTAVALIGNDATDGHVADISILDKGFCEFDGILYFGEYNVNEARISGGTNDKVVIYRSTDLGLTWTNMVEWNTSGHQLRHIHAIKAYGGYLYVCAGDGGTENGIIRWNISTGLWTDNQLISAFDSDTGFDSVAEAERYRTVDLLFKDNYGYLFSDADPATSDDEKGIWRFDPDLSNFERVNSDILDYTNHIGWTGLVTSNGTLVFADYVISAATDRQLNIWTSIDGDTWEIVAKFGVSTSVSTLNIVELDGKIIFSDNNDRGAGKGGTDAAIVSEQGLFDEEFPTVIHPVYWVSVDGTDDTATGRGWSADDPWATLRYAQVADKITLGSRVKVGAGTYVQLTSLLDFDGNSFPGTGITFFEGSGIGSTFITKGIDAAGAYMFYHEEPEGECVYQDMSIYNRSVSTSQRILYVGNSTNAPIVRSRSVQWGKANEPGNAGNRQFSLYGTLDLKNSIVEIAPNQTQPSIDIVGVASVLRGFNSRFYGGEYQVSVGVAGANIKLVNCVFSEFSGRAIRMDGAYDQDPLIQNNIFISSLSSIAMSGTATIETKIDYNNYDGLVAGSTITNGGHSLFVDSKLLADYRLQSDSLCINSGVWVESFHSLGREDMWGKYPWKRINIGADQGAGAPKGGNRSINIGGSGISIQ